MPIELVKTDRAWCTVLDRMEVISPSRDRYMYSHIYMQIHICPFLCSLAR